MTSRIRAAIRVFARHLGEMGSHGAPLACLFLVPTLLSANTYYLSPSGSDSNPGTQSQPFRTVARGITAANPGDTLILADGSYPGDTPYGGGSTSGWLLWINKSGAPGAPITVKAQNPGMAVLNCGNSYNGGQTGCMGYIYFGDPGPGYWVLDGLVFANTYDIAVNMNSSTPAHDITIQHCTFEGIGQHSTTIDTGMDGVYAGQGQYNLTFNDNTFTQIGRTGGANLSHDHGLYLHSANTVVSNNIFFAPITGWGVQTAAGFSGLIANNTFAFNMNNNGGQLMLWDVAGGAITVQNNIFYNPTGGFAVNNCALQAPSCVIDHNIVTNGTIGGNDLCGGGMRCSTSNTISADPMFVNASTSPYNFYYQAGSPAINAGVTLSLVPLDFAGTPRPQNNIYDIGAYEYIFGNTAPAISGVAAANVTTNSATITWTTDQASNSQVEYGLTPAYGSTSPVNAAMVTQHSANLSGFAPATTYHYAVMSANSNGNKSTSGDYTFTTAAAFAFSLSAASGSVSANPGQSVNDTISAALGSGTGQSVAFSLSGAPNGVSASFSSTACTPACSTTLTLAVGGSVGGGIYKLTINAVGGGASTSVPVTLTVVQPVPFAFSVSAASSSLSLTQGQSVTDQITATLVSGTAQSVAFSLTGAPSGVQVGYTASSCIPICSSTVTITAASTAQAGTYQLTAQVTGGGLTETATINLTIATASAPSGVISSGSGSGSGGSSLPLPQDWWPFNEGYGKYTYDLMAHGAFGTLIGGPEWVKGSYGTALQFNGTSSYVSIMDVTSIDLTTALSISFWINASDVPGVDQRIVSKNYDWEVKLNGSAHSPQFSSGPQYYAMMNYSLPMGSWHLVTFTFSSGTVVGYVDGVQQSMAYYTFPSGLTLPTGTYGMNVGADSSESNFAKGIIDDVRLYSQALSAAQIAQLYSQTLH